MPQLAAEAELEFTWMLSLGPPYIAIDEDPPTLREVPVGSRRTMGIADFAPNTPQVACAPTFIVLAPLIMPTKKTLTASPTLTWITGSAGKVGRQIAGIGLAEQDPTPVNELGNENFTLFDAVPVTRPEPL